MSYQALYRVWRPQRFDEVVGQPLITQTLKNAIKLGQTAHAYLLTGPRGTGKTSVAKIFAKAVNCPNSEDGEPCNKCDICKEITQGSLGDVIEIDAASNNGVEEIRDIREKANYAPTRAKNKVYIIDEVHMLSTGAFNALLKTLEEPPENVIFILATTEPHKIPLTIISRTQRFDFKRIQPRDIVEHLAHILDEENISYDEESLTLIAQAAEGGMRDALSILDQILAFADDELNEEIVRQTTGSATQENLLQYLNYIADNEVEKSLSVLQDIIAAGKDQGRLVEDIILITRDILLYQHSGEEIAELFKMAKPTAQLEETAKNLTPQLCYQIIRVFNQTKNDMRTSNHGEVYLEVATIELALPPVSTEANVSGNGQAANQAELSALKKQVSVLTEKLQQTQKSADEPEKEKRQTMRLNSRQSENDWSPDIQAVHRVLREATRPHLNKVMSMWNDFLQTLEVTESAIMNNSKPVAASEQGIVVTFDYDILVKRAANDQVLQEKLNRFMQQVTGHPMKLVALTSDIWPRIRQDFIDQMKKNKEGVVDLTSEDSEAKTKEETGEEAAQKALDLFGAENVEIIDED